MIHFHLAGGEKTTIQLPATFTVMPDGDKLVVDAGSGNVVELAKDEVMCVTYRDAKGDVNGDLRVDVADVSTVVSLIIGAGGSSSVSAPKDAGAVCGFSSSPKSTWVRTTTTAALVSNVYFLKNIWRFQK